MARPSAADLAHWRNLSARIFAAFAAGAGIAQSLEAPPAVTLPFAGIALLGALLALVLLWLERQAKRKEGEWVSAAVGLDLSRDPDATRLWVVNRGLHLVRDIQVTAMIPGDEDPTSSTYAQLPPV